MRTRVLIRWCSVAQFNRFLEKSAYLACHTTEQVHVRLAERCECGSTSPKAKQNNNCFLLYCVFTMDGTNPNPNPGTKYTHECPLQKKVSFFAAGETVLGPSFETRFQRLANTEEGVIMGGFNDSNGNLSTTYTIHPHPHPLESSALSSRVVLFTE